MTKYEITFLVLSICTFIFMILYVFFGEYTVKKLRKIAETKEELGIDTVGGKDILNVAMALTIPRKLNRKLRTTPVGDYFADADKIYPHTKLFDRIIARVLYWLTIIITVGFLSLALVKYLSTKT